MLVLKVLGQDLTYCEGPCHEELHIHIIYIYIHICMYIHATYVYIYTPIHIDVYMYICISLYKPAFTTRRFMILHTFGVQVLLFNSPSWHVQV